MPTLILTYHRVCGDESQPRSFYDVPLPALERHLAALHAAKVPPLDPAALPGTAGPGYLLTFDDGTRDHAEVVAPALRARGERGIFFIPTAKIGTPCCLTAAEVRALTDAGHIVGCHSHEHARLDRLGAAQVRAQLTTALDRLREITGRDTAWFAPPGGFSSATVRAVAAELGLRAVRTMRWGRNDPLRLDRLECIPLSRAISPGRFEKILDGHGLAWLKALYFGKQALKAFLPLRAYERARANVFRRPNI